MDQERVSSNEIEGHYITLSKDSKEDSKNGYQLIKTITKADDCRQTCVSDFDCNAWFYDKVNNICYITDKNVGTDIKNKDYQEGQIGGVIENTKKNNLPDILFWGFIFLIIAVIFWYILFYIVLPRMKKGKTGVNFIYFKEK